MRKKQRLEVGDMLHDLTVIRLDHKDSRSRRFLLCKCVCGKTKVIQASLITSGNTKSCGCRVKKAAISRKLPDNGGVINQIILGYKRHAKDRKLAWGLSIQDVRKLIKGNCAYCGEPPNNLKITKNCQEGFIYNGIDRVNPKRGYFTNNVVSCCFLCNRAKNNLSLEQFKIWIKKLNAMAEQWR